MIVKRCLRTVLLLLCSLGRRTTFAQGVCLPVLDRKGGPPIGFIDVLATPNGRWVVAETAVYYVADQKDQSAATYVSYGLGGDHETSRMVIGNTLWLGTDRGAWRFDAVADGKPNTSIMFPPIANISAGPQTSSTQQGSLVSEAFGYILFSRPGGVYRYDGKGGTQLTTLVPGRAFGAAPNGPYWWVTPGGVFALDKQLVAREVWKGTVTQPSPIATDTYLWVVDKKHFVVAISPVGDVIKAFPTGADVLSLVKSKSGDVWVSTRQDAYHISGFTLSPANFEGGITILSVLSDRLLYGRCLSEDEQCNPPALYEASLADAQRKNLLTGLRNGSVTDDKQDTLYVPTDSGLYVYDLTSHEGVEHYKSSLVQFVMASRGAIWLATHLDATKPSDSVTNTYVHLCEVHKDITETAVLSGRGPFSLFLGSNSRGVLIGSELVARPTFAPQLKGIDMMICRPDQAAKCTDDKDWQDSIPISFTAKLIDHQLIHGFVRQNITHEPVPVDLNLWIISDLTCLVIIMIGVLGAVVVAAPRSSGARQALFLLLPSTGLKAYCNVAVLVLSRLGAYRRQLLRPILLAYARWEKIAERDREAADRTNVVSGESSFIVYDCDISEIEERIESLCSLIANTSLACSQDRWRLPIPVRLRERPEGDIKAALSDRLQPYALDNELLVEQVMRSRQVIFILYDFGQLDSKGSGAVTRTIAMQVSHAICITDGSPVPLGPSICQLTSELKKRLTDEADIAGNS